MAKLQRYRGKKRSPYENLDDLAKALKWPPRMVVFCSGDTVGGQGGVQAALIAKAAGIDIAEWRHSIQCSATHPTQL